MPYPNLTASVIVINQTSGSAVGGNFPFVETQLSGSNFFLRTDANGVITGSTDLSASIIKGGTVSASAVLYSGGSSVLSTITSSAISSSGIISGSNGWFNNITVAGTLTAPGLTVTSASYALSSSYATASFLATSASYANSLDRTVNYSVASISASGNISASNANVGILNTYDATQVSSFTNASTVHVGGVAIQKDLWVSGSLLVGGNLTLLGTSSIVNISSSNLILGDNRIVLNAYGVGNLPQRYVGFDMVDSGSTNNVTSSLLWDSQNNYWLLTNNQSGSSISSSAVILQGPSSSFGSEPQLAVNNFLKVATAIGNLTSSNLSETSGQLQYLGTISGSTVSSSLAYVSNTITATSGSFTALTVVTGSSPGVGNVPSGPASPGMAGQIEIDNNFLYVFTSGVWKRIPLSNWVS